MSQVNYTITHFDPVLKLIQVNFEAGHWAPIHLHQPFPANANELAAIVRQFAPTEQQLEAAQADPSPLEFIAELVGVPQTVERISSQPVQELVAPDAAQREAEEAAELEEARIAVIVRKVMAEQQKEGA